MVFYYTYWEFEYLYGKNRFSHHVLLLSATLLIHAYPNSTINILVYDFIPKSLDILKSLPQVNIILLKCYVDKKQEENQLLNINLTNDKTFTFLLSKPIDVFNLAKEKNEIFILLDVDFFVFNKFQNLDINKIGFLFYNNNLDSNVNTGLIVSGTQSFECKYFFDLYESFLKLFDNQNHLIKEKLVSFAYPHPSAQEEIIISSIVKKFTELKNVVFYDITSNNHQLYCCNIYLNYQNNIHTMNMDKKRICSVMCQLEHVKKVLNRKDFYIIKKELIEYSYEQEFNQEEQRLIKNINNSMLVKDKRIFL